MATSLLDVVAGWPMGRGGWLAGGHLVAGSMVGCWWLGRKPVIMMAGVVNWTRDGHASYTGAAWRGFGWFGYRPRSVVNSARTNRRAGRVLGGCRSAVHQ